MGGRLIQIYLNRLIDLR